jgi:lysophospholipid acyltransferase (LPLAT)-like uncharacterized protein
MLVALWRLTCSYKVVNDPRPALREKGQGYIYALLHAHQIAAVFINDEKQMAAMVSRSTDGDLLVPSLELRGIIPVRGSTRRRGKDKGGRAALEELKGLVSRGTPVLLAVDGPQGPRNHVHRGIVDLMLDTQAPVLPVVVLPSRRFILSGTWDRMQMPSPFSRIRLIFGEPLTVGSDDTDMRETIAQCLMDLEHNYDPEEALLATPRNSE